jgi:hypothetical protein
VVTITSVTEVIEVIGYHLWRGVLWPYLAGRLREYSSFNPENWIRSHIREKRSWKNLGSRCLSRPRSHLGFRYRSLRGRSLGPESS